MVKPTKTLIPVDMKQSYYILKSELSKNELTQEEYYDKFIKLVALGKADCYDILFNVLNNKINHNKIYNCSHLLCTYYTKQFKLSINEMILSFYSKLLIMSITLLPNGYIINDYIRSSLINVLSTNPSADINTNWVMYYRKILTLTLSKLPDKLKKLNNNNNNISNINILCSQCVCHYLLYGENSYIDCINKVDDTLNQNFIKELLNCYNYLSMNLNEKFSFGFIPKGEEYINVFILCNRLNYEIIKTQYKSSINISEPIPIVGGIIHDIIYIIINQINKYLNNNETLVTSYINQLIYLLRLLKIIEEKTTEIVKYILFYFIL